MFIHNPVAKMKFDLLNSQYLVDFDGNFWHIFLWLIWSIVQNKLITSDVLQLQCFSLCSYLPVDKWCDRNGIEVMIRFFVPKGRLSLTNMQQISSRTNSPQSLPSTKWYVYYKLKQSSPFVQTLFPTKYLPSRSLSEGDGLCSPWNDLFVIVEWLFGLVMFRYSAGSSFLVLSPTAGGTCPNFV